MSNLNLKIFGNSLYGYDGSSESITIPKNIEFIHDKTFSGDLDIKEITCPESLIGIGNFAFSGCRNLKKIVLNDGLKKVGKYPFKLCTSLEEITIPDSIEEMEEGAFYLPNIKVIHTNLKLSMDDVGNSYKTFRALGIKNIKYDNSFLYHFKNSYYENDDFTYLRDEPEFLEKILVPTLQTKKDILPYLDKGYIYENNIDLLLDITASLEDTVLHDKLIDLAATSFENKLFESIYNKGISSRI